MLFLFLIQLLLLPILQTAGSEFEGKERLNDSFIKNLFHPDTDDIDVRLPSTVVPVKYNVYLTPFLIPDNFTIEGHVDILVEVLEIVENITLHINNITIDEDSVTVTRDNDEVIEVTGHIYDTDLQFYIIQLGQPVQPGRYSLAIDFTANLNDGLAGFYRSSYTDEMGEVQLIATTQFEPTDARRAFPCFDEPAMKAVFQINLGRTQDVVSISNMPAEERGVERPGTHYVWDIYQDSAVMSTYLVAMVVGKFVERTTEPLQNNVNFSIWSRPAAYGSTELAADFAPRVLQYYEDYFGTPFPLPKQDMVALPDFGPGAMENWGLITYKEDAILYEEGVTSVLYKEFAAEVIAHELAHQWFGDLVTMEWWTDLWLNEGFATYVQYIGANHVLPNSSFLERYILDSVQVALELDALESSHPVSIPVNSPDEINEIFDTISYAKGCSIIRMMANFLTLDTFNKGLANYIRGNAYHNANQDTLWAYLTEAAVEDGTLPSNLTVKDIMDTWTLQMGYPVVSVERNYVEGSVSFGQKRFLISPSGSNDSHVYLWYVPITFTVPNQTFIGTSPPFWLTPESDADEALELEPDKAIVVNVQQTGYYRVNYDTENWLLLAGTLRESPESIHRMNRAQLLDDAFNLARAGLLDYNTALDLTAYLENERDYFPWDPAFKGFSYIERMFQTMKDDFSYLQTYMQSLLQTVFDDVGFEEQPDEGILSSKLRMGVVETLCKLDYPECTEQSVELFQQWMQAPDPDQESPIPNLIREPVLCSAIANGTEEEWNFLWERFTNSDNANEVQDILSALGCSRDLEILNMYLEKTIDESSGIKRQDGWMGIKSVGLNPLGRDLAWNWLRANWDMVSSVYDIIVSDISMPGVSPAVSVILKAIAGSFNTEEDLVEITEFYTQHQDDLGTSVRATEQLVENTRSNIAWMKNNYETVLTWLQNGV